MAADEQGLDLAEELAKAGQPVRVGLGAPQAAAAHEPNPDGKLQKCFEII